MSLKFAEHELLLFPYLVTTRPCDLLGGPARVPRGRAPQAALTAHPSQFFIRKTSREPLSLQVKLAMISERFII